MILDINKITNQVKDELDDIRDLNLSQPKEQLLGNIYMLTRYSECYTTLNYLQTKEIDKINDSIAIIMKQIKQIEDLLKEITPLNDNKGGVIND